MFDKLLSDKVNIEFMLVVFQQGIICYFFITRMVCYPSMRGTLRTKLWENARVLRLVLRVEMVVFIIVARPSSIRYKTS